tara:strand:+ start:1733 stop:2125 length:393 start_codon:yes stop_codon:yes gene_type:complete
MEKKHTGKQHEVDLIHTRQVLIKTIKDERNCTVRVDNLEDLHWFLLWGNRHLGFKVITNGGRGLKVEWDMKRALRFKQWPFPVYFAYTEHHKATLWWYGERQFGEIITVQNLREARDIRGQSRVANMRWR